MQTGRYYIQTFGCQMNVRDSQSAAGVLEQMGYTAAKLIQQADIICFNTCCIRELAESKAIAAIGRIRALKAANPDLIIAVFGCMSEQDEAARLIATRFPFVDILFGTHQLHTLAGRIEGTIRRRGAVQAGGLQDEFILPAQHDRWPLAYINIIHGCNNYCSYCIVPYVRGRESSKPMDQIISEADALVAAGYSEITLLGQNVNSYDDKGHGFADLLRRLNQTGIERIRFMTSHPKDLSEEMIQAMADCSHVCRHIHLPVQSGSDAVLQRMNRRYTHTHYLSLISALRGAMPHIGITTDLIVGFPGETQNDYLDTLSLARQVQFDAAFTFAFSPRAGTRAAGFSDQVPKEIKEARLQQLIQVQHGASHTLLHSLTGSRADVLVEGQGRYQGQMTGRTSRGQTVNFEAEPSAVGQVMPVCIIQARGNTLLGEAV